MEIDIDHGVPPVVQWRWRQAGLLTSCSSSSDGRLLVCAADPQNAVYIIDAASGQTLHHVSGTTRQRYDTPVHGHIGITVGVGEVVSVFPPRSPPLHHHTLSVRPPEPASGHRVCRPQHQTVGPAGSEDHRVHRQVTNTSQAFTHLFSFSSAASCSI